MNLFEFQIDKKLPTYIYGTGIKAGKMYYECTKKEIPVLGFIDRCDSTWVGHNFWGLCVYTIDQVERDSNVIIASSFWKEILDRLKQQGITNCYVDNRLIQPVEMNGGYIQEVGNYSFDKHTVYILCPYGLGDTLYVCAFIRDYKREKKKDRVCVIVKKTHLIIPQCFSCIDEIIADDELVHLMNLWAVNHEVWELNNFLYGHFRKRMDLTFIRSENVILDGMVSQYRREVMGLTEHSSIAAEDYALPAVEMDDVDGEKNILLVPYANSMRMLPMSLWEELAMDLTGFGYQVYTNVKDQKEKPIKNTKPIYAKIEEIVSFGKKCKAVIAVRNGLCDIMAFEGVSLVVIYTEQAMYQEWDLKYISDDIEVKNILAFESGIQNVKIDIMKACSLVDNRNG